MVSDPTERPSCAHAGICAVVTPAAASPCRQLLPKVCQQEGAAAPRRGAVPHHLAKGLPGQGMEVARIRVPCGNMACACIVEGRDGKIQLSRV